jgi:hypothetical protein
LVCLVLVWSNMTLYLVSVFVGRQPPVP